MGDLGAVRADPIKKKQDNFYIDYTGYYTNYTFHQLLARMCPDLFRLSPRRVRFHDVVVVKENMQSRRRFNSNLLDLWYVADLTCRGTDCIIYMITLCLHTVEMRGR